MTQMQSPYHESTETKLYQEPERTSLMAILSLVFGIGGCCMGITSIPAIFLGIFGLVGISRSKGRVGGSGFGIAGILIGLLTLALWGGILGAASYGMSSMEKMFGANIEQVMLDIQADNFDSARSLLSSPAADSSDEELIIFRDGYRGSLGDFVSKTDGFGDLLSGYMAIGELIQPYQGQQGYVPLPMHFDSGYGLVIFVIDTSGSGALVAEGLIIIDSQGNEFTLPVSSVAMPAGGATDSDVSDRQGADDESGDESINDGP